jgi:hypothetical protein
VSRGQKYVLSGKTPAGIGIHRACEDSGMDAEDLRRAVYRAFAETGGAPEPGELATKLGTGAREVAAGLAELARGRHLALGDQGQIVMAHPFSAVPLGFSVMGTPVSPRPGADHISTASHAGGASAALRVAVCMIVGT